MSALRATSPWSFPAAPQLRGAASRRQWWLGHLSAALLRCLGFLGGIVAVTSAILQFGLDLGEFGCRLLVLTAAGLCVGQFARASNALCRQRLSERGEPHDLVDACLGLAGLDIALAANGAARTLMRADWPLPAAPHWIVVAAAILSIGCLAALVLECGVLERLSLTELWRGGQRQAPSDGRVEA